MTLTSDQPTEATIMAGGSAVVSILDRDKFMELINSNPELRDEMDRVLAKQCGGVSLE